MLRWHFELRSQEAVRDVRGKCVSVTLTKALKFPVWESYIPSWACLPTYNMKGLGLLTSGSPSTYPRLQGFAQIPTADACYCYGGSPEVQPTRLPQAFSTMGSNFPGGWVDPGVASLNWKERDLTLAMSFSGNGKETMKPPAPADPPA